MHRSPAAATNTVKRGNYYTLRKFIIVCRACSFWDDEPATQCGGKCNHLCSWAAPKQPQSAHPRTYTMSLYVQPVFCVFLWSLTYYFLLIFGHKCLQREKNMFLQFFKTQESSLTYDQFIFILWLWSVVALSVNIAVLSFLLHLIHHIKWACQPTMTPTVHNTYCLTSISSTIALMISFSGLRWCSSFINWI